MMNTVQNFGCWWKLSIFCRNFWVLKVIAHEMSEKIQKKVEFLNFMEYLMEVLIIISKDECYAKVWVLMEIFNFLSKFLGFKGPIKWVTKSQKNYKFPNFMVWLKEVMIIISNDEYCAKFWVLMEIMNFLSKILGFKGYSSRNEW